MAKPLIHVVAGVVYNESGQVLIAKRASHQHQGGLWEFPGGKVEAGETAQSALQRELHEELGISVEESEPLIQVVHHYSDRSVLLDVWSVKAFSGEAYGVEGQPLCWVDIFELNQYAFPAANLPILKAIKLPPTIAITGDASSRQHWFNNFRRLLTADIGAIQIRSASIPASTVLTYIKEAYELCKSKGVLLFLNSRLAPIEELVKLPCDGVHLTGQDWLGLTTRPIPSKLLLSLPCHSAEDLARAELQGADLVLLSPVLATATHPYAEILDWPKFAELCLNARVPVFGLGGLGKQHLDQARLAGAQGVAGIGEFWQSN